MGRFIGMSNGKEIDPYAYVFNKDFDLECVAKSLSNICRYNGHYGWMSVAEHCITVSNIMGDMWNSFYQGSKEEWMMMGLLHDFAESVFGDIVSPVKYHNMFRELRIMEDCYIDAAYIAHGFYPGQSARRKLHDADRYAMSLELNLLGYYNDEPWTDQRKAYPVSDYPNIKVVGYKNTDAEYLWLETYNNLQKRRSGLVI